MCMKLKIVLGLLVVLAVSYPDFIEGRCSNSNPCQFKGKGEPLKKPDELISSGGVLKIVLNVDMCKIKFDWLTTHRRCYNNKIPGPTWRINRGDRVNLTINNLLTNPQKDEPFNGYRYPNSTNVHTHGLHISSEKPQDDVFIKIDPGKSYTYQYHIDPENPAGTFWYHPHLHGSTMLQVGGGMGGIIIVEDPTNGPGAATPELAAVSCPANCHNEVHLIFQSTLAFGNSDAAGYAYIQQVTGDYEFLRHQHRINSTTKETLNEWLKNNVEIFTTNGQVFPVLSLSTGQMKRFRMVNAAGNQNLEIHIVDAETLVPSTGCQFMEIAFDGVYLDTPRAARLGKTVITSAARADWLVVCNKAGIYKLRSDPNSVDAISIGDFQRYRGLLLTINVTGPTTSKQIVATLPKRPTFLRDFRDLQQDEVDGRFVIEVNAGDMLSRDFFASEFDYRFKSALGSVQEWYIINTDTESGHPIHIHVNHFQIISYNPYTGPISFNNGSSLVLYTQDKQLCYYQSTNYIPGTKASFPPNYLQYLGHDKRSAVGGQGTLGYVATGEFRDVIIVPPLVNITIRFMAHRYPGTVTIHCHILAHEDLGMMLTTQIVNKSAGVQMTANTYSVGAAPGQCKPCDPFPFNKDISHCRNTFDDFCPLPASSNSMYLLFLLIIPISIILFIALWVFCRRNAQKYNALTTNEEIS